MYILLDRAIKLSHVQFHQNKLTIISELLSNNSYPNKFIDTNITNRLFFINNTQHTQKGKNNDTLSIDNSQQRKKFVVLPSLKTLVLN